MGIFDNLLKRRKTTEEFVYHGLVEEIYKLTCKVKIYVLVIWILVLLGVVFFIYNDGLNFITKTYFMSFTTVTSDIKKLAHDITDNDDARTEEQKIISISAWVSRNIQYESELWELPQTPEFTLNSGVGDCEDYAILTVSLLKAIGIDSDFHLSNFHAMVIVKPQRGVFYLLEPQSGAMQEVVVI